MCSRADPSGSAEVSRANGDSTGSHTQRWAGIEGQARSETTEAWFSERLSGVRSRLWMIAAAILADRVEADDIVQEAAVLGLRKRGEFAVGTSFEAWMGQITRNLALNALRSRERRSASLGKVRALAQSRLSGGVSGSDQTGNAGLEPALHEALIVLEPMARECLMLRVVSELSYREIAEIVGVPEGTAMSHVHRSRQRLREHLLAGGATRLASGKNGGMR